MEKESQASPTEKASQITSVDEHGNSTDEEQSALATALEKTILAKMDIRLLPVLTLMFLLSVLDRSNIGNARLAGLQKDLNLSNKQYSISLTVTLIGYIVAELPFNWVLKVVGPDVILPTMLTLWGVVTTLQGVVHNYQGLLACRFFLGLLEGGIFPGIVLYLSFFYPRKRLQLRVALFWSAASLSGAFSGLLAFAIINMDGIGGRPGWAWIFFLEGLFTVVFGVISFFLLPRSVNRTRFLTSEEKEFLSARLISDGAISENEIQDGFSWREVRKALALPQVWFIAIIFFFAGTILSSLSYFTPSILVGLGYTASRAQLMSVPPYVTAFAVTVSASFFSDRFGFRGPTAMFASTLCVIGFAMYLSSRDPHVQYGSLFLSITGINCSGPALATWLANNAAPQTRRATAIAIGFIMTNFGGILALWLFSTLSAPPRYTKGTITLLVSAIMMAVLAFLNLLYLRRENQKKAVARRQGTRERETEGLGDRSAWFIYSL
ncbi:major facilitator superfamily domain-containing protein [Lyophyllum atratum]|nr:major facilitator superfamily domain-containing protein [Lyophyllum atratum]